MNNNGVWADDQFVPPPSHLPSWIPFALGWFAGAFFTAGLEIAQVVIARHLR